MIRQSHMFEADNGFNYFRYVGGAEGVEAMQDFIRAAPKLSGSENEAQMILLI